MYWLIGIITIFVLTFVIIKLRINTKENSNSCLGILEHPNTIKKQYIEMVDDNLNNDKPENLFNNNKFSKY